MERKHFPNLPTEIKIGTRMYAVDSSRSNRLRQATRRIKLEPGQVWLTRLGVDSAPFRVNWPMRLHSSTPFFQCVATWLLIAFALTASTPTSAQNLWEVELQGDNVTAENLPQLESAPSLDGPWSVALGYALNHLASDHYRLQFFWTAKCYRMRDMPEKTAINYRGFNNDGQHESWGHYRTGSVDGWEYCLSDPKPSPPPCEMRIWPNPTAHDLYATCNAVWSVFDGNGRRVIGPVWVKAGEPILVWHLPSAWYTAVTSRFAGKFQVVNQSER